jgi:endonuclease YncB( thermonuclease family)
VKVWLEEEEEELKKHQEKKKKKKKGAWNPDPDWIRDGQDQS